MERRLIELVRAWLDRVLPEGTFHAAAVSILVHAVEVALALAFFLAVRWVIVRALRHVLVPALTRISDDPHAATRARTLERLAVRAVTATLLFITAVTLLGYFGLDVSAILTGAGVLGLALSFGAQRLVRDVLTGFFLLMEDQIRIGDHVTLVGGPGIPQFAGAILDLELRRTVLQDPTGKVVSIGNGDIAAVINHTRSATAAVEVGVAPEASWDKVREAIAAARLPDGGPFAGPAVAQAITAADGTRVTVRALAAVRLGHAPEAEPLLRAAVLEAVRAAGIGPK